MHDYDVHGFLYQSCEIHNFSVRRACDIAGSILTNRENAFTFLTPLLCTFRENLNTWL